MGVAKPPITPPKVGNFSNFPNFHPPTVWEVWEASKLSPPKVWKVWGGFARGGENLNIWGRAGTGCNH